ncbi:MAG: TlpA disulfide reductase family protein [Nannocystaceae bacterium]
MESLILASRGGDVSPDYLQRVLDEHPDLLVVGAAAFALASEAQGRGDTERVRAVVTRLRQRGADSPLGRFALEFDPDDQLAEGRPVPPFRLHALDGGAEIDSESLRGKVVVLHFWATWCRPCVDKLPALAALHARHAAAGLEVVSLSIDEDPAVIAAFRSAMPWTHAWEPPETAEALRARYQVAGSTKAIVIGRDGVVVAEHLEVSDPEFEARIVEALARR